MDTIPQADLEGKVSELLEVFYGKRISKLQELRLEKVLAEKNPYLYRAIGANDASAIVRTLLDAIISSSDETIFGNDFFEPLAIWVAERAHHSDNRVQAGVATGEGADLQITTPTQIRFYAIKSGKNVFNGPSKKRQLQEFAKARSRLSKVQKQFDAVIGYAYGRKASRAEGYREIIGQGFWEELTGEPDFYLRIAKAMGKGANHRISAFREEYDKALNRFTMELLANFSDSQGDLDWETLVAYNSATVKPKRAWIASIHPLLDDIVVELEDTH